MSCQAINPYLEPRSRQAELAVCCCCGKLLRGRKIEGIWKWVSVHMDSDLEIKYNPNQTGAAPAEL